MMHYLIQVDPDLQVKVVHEYQLISYCISSLKRAGQKAEDVISLIKFLDYIFMNKSTAELEKMVDYYPLEAE